MAKVKYYTILIRTTLFFNRDHTTEKGGIIFLGGIEPKHISGSITYVPVVTKAFWQIAMDQ